jgi:hypothetical protein
VITHGISCQPSRSRAIVDSEVATMVWSRLASSIASTSPLMIEATSRFEKRTGSALGTEDMINRLGTRRRRAPAARAA